MKDEIRWEVYDEWLNNGELKLQQIIDLVAQRENLKIDEFLKDLEMIRTAIRQELPDEFVERILAPCEKKWKEKKA